MKSIRISILRKAVGGWALGASLAGCTLSTDDVEPALPAVPVLNSNTVVYHFNGLPVVAHNYSSVLINVYGGNRLAPVDMYFGADSSLVVRGLDRQNEDLPGLATHELTLVLPHFHGVGRYRPDVGQTTFQLDIRDAANQNSTPGALQTLDRQLPDEVEITQWTALPQHVRGTFNLHFPAQGTSPDALLSEGSFDMSPTR